MRASHLVHRCGPAILFVVLGAFVAPGCGGDLGGDPPLQAGGPQDPDAPLVPINPTGGSKEGSGGGGTTAAGGAGGTEEAAIGPTYEAGTALVTTANLNLRVGEGTDTEIVTLMPEGSGVTVVETSGSNGWVHVEFQGQTGYGWYEYLALPPPPIDATYDPTRGATLASKAVELWSGSSSGGYCLKGVRISAQQSGILPDPPGWHYEGSAIEWGDWANGNPNSLAAIGFKRVDADVNELPIGTIIVWQPGQCGYHAQYGHVEIIVDNNSSKACSDFCGNVKKTCGNPWVYIPTVL